MKFFVYVGLIFYFEAFVSTDPDCSLLTLGANHPVWFTEVGDVCHKGKLAAAMGPANGGPNK